MEKRSNNRNEEWVKLEKYGIPEGEYILTEFTQNENGTLLTLDDGKVQVCIHFDGIPLLVRQSVEGLRMRTWSEVQLKYRDYKTYFRSSFFFEVKNSLLVDWAVEEACGFYQKSRIKHYCIVTREDVIDILAEFEPVVTIGTV